MTRLSLHPHEVVAEFIARTRSPRQDQIAAFARQGISVWAAAGRPDSGEWSVTFARTERLADGRFEFKDDGVPSMCTIALDAFGEPSDIVAWPLKGGWIGPWIGRESMLGRQHVDGPRLGDALAIFPSPMDWLRGDRDGVVLIDLPRAARELRDAGTLLATGGIEHAARLVSLLTPPPPNVLVPVDEERRAA